LETMAVLEELNSREEEEEFLEHVEQFKKDVVEERKKYEPTTAEKIFSGRVYSLYLKHPRMLNPGRFKGLYDDVPVPAKFQILVGFISRYRLKTYKAVLQN